MTVQSQLQLNLVDPAPGRRVRSDVILGGRLTILTPKGLQGGYRMLLESATGVKAGHILTVSCPTPIPALGLALLKPESTITCFHHDLYHTDISRRLAEKHGMDSVRHQCDSTLAGLLRPPDLVISYNSAGSEKGITLEWFRQALLHLAPGGRLLVATPNKTDRWIRKQIQTIFGDVSILEHSRHGNVYCGKKGKLADSDRENLEAKSFYVRQVEVVHYSRKLVFDTCYGVPNGEALDEGSRALLETMKPEKPLARMLDLGCGWGGASILAAQIHGAGQMTLIESGARAILMARRNVERHGLSGCTSFRHEANCESILDSGGEEGLYDAVISNPPHAADRRIADLFVRASYKALKTGGQAWMVCKADSGLHEKISAVYGRVDVLLRRGCRVYTATKK